MRRIDPREGQATRLVSPPSDSAAFIHGLGRLPGNGTLFREREGQPVGRPIDRPTVQCVYVRKKGVTRLRDETLDDRRTEGERKRRVRGWEREERVIPARTRGSNIVVYSWDGGNKWFEEPTGTGPRTKDTLPGRAHIATAWTRRFEDREDGRRKKVAYRQRGRTRGWVPQGGTVDVANFDSRGRYNLPLALKPASRFTNAFTVTHLCTTKCVSRYASRCS